MHPLAVPNCSFPEAENSFCFLFLVYLVANGVQLNRTLLEEIIKMPKKKKGGVCLTQKLTNKQRLISRLFTAVQLVVFFI